MAEIIYSLTPPSPWRQPAPGPRPRSCALPVRHSATHRIGLCARTRASDGKARVPLIAAAVLRLRRRPRRSNQRRALGRVLRRSRHYQAPSTRATSLLGYRASQRCFGAQRDGVFAQCACVPAPGAIAVDDAVSVQSQVSRLSAPRRTHLRHALRARRDSVDLGEPSADRARRPGKGTKCMHDVDEVTDRQTREWAGRARVVRPAPQSPPAETADSEHGAHPHARGAPRGPATRGCERRAARRARERGWSVAEENYTHSHSFRH